jgi:hypothetical protein
MCRKFQMASPLLSMTRKYLSQTEDLDVKKHLHDAKGGGWRSEATPVSQVSTSKRPHPHYQGHQPQANLATKTNKTTGKSTEVNLIRGTRLMARSPRTIWTMKSSHCSSWRPSCSPDEARSLWSSSRCRCFRSSVHWWRPSLPSGKLRLSRDWGGSLVDSYLHAYAGGKAMLMRSPSIIADYQPVLRSPWTLRSWRSPPWRFTVILIRTPSDPFWTKPVPAIVWFNGLLQILLNISSSTGINDVVHLFTARTSLELPQLGALTLEVFATRVVTMKSTRLAR